MECLTEPPLWHAEFTKEELVQKLSTTTKSADHLNGLLRETEATNAILMEQIKVRSKNRKILHPDLVCMHTTQIESSHFSYSHRVLPFTLDS